MLVDLHKANMPMPSVPHAQSHKTYVLTRARHRLLQSGDIDVLPVGHRLVLREEGLVHCTRSKLGLSFPEHFIRSSCFEDVIIFAQQVSNEHLAQVE